MINFSYTPSSPMSAKHENHRTNYGIFGSCNSSGGHTTDLGLPVISTFTFVVCIFGLVGNGAVVWLLGFCMKRTPFSIYILNLAVADFGVLISSIPRAGFHIVRKHLDDIMPKLHFVSLGPFYFTYSMSQFLLTAISIDRCVSVLFPLWYRYRRPKSLSTALCLLMWLLYFLVQGICLTIEIIWELKTPLFYAFLVNSLVCLPLITVSTLILFVKFCFKSQQHQRGKLLTAVLLTLFFFLIFAFPLNVIYLIRFSPWSSPEVRSNVRCYNVTEYGLLCASLNSFANPLLYFLVGRKKKGLCRENLKLILQRVFIEEETSNEEPGTQS
ncbi:mas-related G-protein coupled receptor member H-like [Tiliqua scincoides]|uniref:mas-related G-protein coupled receptor member H-like n=1 Tax=Tiliqua scincoides TaxID=71010 RepID=UPI0034625FEB